MSRAESPTENASSPPPSPPPRPRDESDSDDDSPPITLRVRDFASYKHRMQMLTMMHHASEIAYDGSRDVEERFRALMHLHYAQWGVTHRPEGDRILGNTSRVKISSFVRNELAAGALGVRRDAAGRKTLGAGELGAFPVFEEGGEEVVTIPVSVLVWMICALGAEFKLPDLKGA